VAMMAEAGAFLVPTFISLIQRLETADEHHLPPAIVDNLRRTIDRGKQVYAWAREAGVPLGLGTDLWGPEAQHWQLRELQARTDFETTVNILRSATAVNADLLMQKGELGTIAPGALADILLVEGDPLADITVMLNPDQNLKFIMQDGAIRKNTLAQAVR